MRPGEGVKPVAEVQMEAAGGGGWQPVMPDPAQRGATLHYNDA